jgi:hypothetical protein
MHVTFALFADAANLSQEGKLNILGVFDAVQVAAFPAVHPRATLVVRLKGSHADIGPHEVTMSWTNPIGVELWNSTGNLELGGLPPDVAEADLPLIAQLDLPADMAGDYTMRILVDRKPAAEIGLMIRAATPAVPLPAPAPNGLVS